MCLGPLDNTFEAIDEHNLPVPSPEMWPTVSMKDDMCGLLFLGPFDGSGQEDDLDRIWAESFPKTLEQSGIRPRRAQPRSLSVLSRGHVG